MAAGIALTLVGCEPSPVDMIEHPVTSTTPSRMAGQELRRAADPDSSCATRPAAAEFDGTGSRSVDGVAIPRSPQRVLALGAGAVDTACALGVQDVLIGIGGLPDGARIYLPETITGLPRIELAAKGAAQQVRELRPDLIVVGSGADADSASLADLATIAPVVRYDAAGASWTTATETVANALGRPRAGHDLLLDVIGRARDTGLRTGSADTRVSLVRVGAGGQARAEVAAPDSLGSLMLEAAGAARPPAQLTRDGRSVPPPADSPAAGDPLSGDVIVAVVAGPAEADAARAVFASDRWQALGAVRARRLFVVDAAVWEGAGPVAAHAVLADIANSINAVAPL